MSDEMQRQWMPEDYLDEVVPPPRPHPTEWVARLDGGGYALDNDAFYADEDEAPRLLIDGETVLFAWTVILDAVDPCSGSLPPLPDGASEWMAAPEGEPVSFDDAKAAAEPYDMLTPYCWSRRPVPFVFRDGQFHPAEPDHA